MSTSSSPSIGCPPAELKRERRDLPRVRRNAKDAEESTDVRLELDRLVGEPEDDEATVLRP